MKEQEEVGVAALLLGHAHCGLLGLQVPDANREGLREPGCCRLQKGKQGTWKRWKVRSRQAPGDSLKGRSLEEGRLMDVGGRCPAGSSSI